ncbi:hypothetical protein BS50DRAFT_499485 [Corynespora cassiicola Philippines]|uniref:Uncharacterized protein n=1 Tax=Corynespora cassiicola Philippines TaxID=1448308 RepID=A0A2T2NE30_CORCC|nr:hypothetical protein BS50DRAFT_499485 [Corynespora cassiicola Philippines]
MIALSHPTHSATMTTTLPILPRPSAPQRPKLHIDTQQLRTFGKGSSLRLDTLSAVSPTIRNTFSNAYEPTKTAAPTGPAAPAPPAAAPAPAPATPTAGRPEKPRLSIDSNISSATSSTPTSASTLSSALTSASSYESATITVPYKQPHNLTSILSNSPAKHLLPRKMAPARPFFPAQKRVSFRTPLEEEIKTVRYTMAHSDIESSSSTLSSLASTDSDSSDKSLSSSVSAASSAAAISSKAPSLLSPTHPSGSSSFSSLELSPRPNGPRTGEKRDSSSSEESDSDSCPETPVAGRRKRRRDWRWTLGPIGSDKSISATESEDSS